MATRKMLTIGASLILALSATIVGSNVTSNRLSIGGVSTVFAYPTKDCGPANDGEYLWDDADVAWYRCRYDFNLQGWYWIQTTDPPVVRDTGKSKPQLASNFPQRFRHVRIENNTPGVKNLTV